MPDSNTGYGPYVRRVLFAAAVLIVVVVLLYLLATLTQTLLVLFAGVLLAVLLNGMSRAIESKVPVSHSVALALVVVGIMLLLTAFAYFVGPNIGDQFERLTVRLPQVLVQLKSSLENYQWGRMLLNKMPNVADVLPFGRRQLISAPAAFSSLFGLLVNVVIVLFIGIYLAASPHTYIESVLSLFPPQRRDRLREVVHTINRVLHRFFVGRFASMALVGGLSAIGYWLAGIPLAFVLGVIAGLLEFVPFIGPLIALIPALLLSIAQGPVNVVYVLIVYTVIQTAESYLITPLIERFAVSIPPGALISIQIIMGAVFGVVGIFLATPLAVMVIVAIQMLYIHDVLRDNVRLLGH